MTNKKFQLISFLWWVINIYKCIERGMWHMQHATCMKLKKKNTNRAPFCRPFLSFLFSSRQALLFNVKMKVVHPWSPDWWLASYYRRGEETFERNTFLAHCSFPHQFPKQMQFPTKWKSFHIKIWLMNCEKKELISSPFTI